MTRKISHAGSRNKGQEGEREMSKFLHELIRAVQRDCNVKRLYDIVPEIAESIISSMRDGISRNLAQSRFGGADITMCPRIMVEVKRQEQLSIGTWWKQAVKQTRDYNHINHRGKGNPQRRIPVLAYRQNRKAWVFCVPAEVLCGKHSKNWDEFISMDKVVFRKFLYNIYTQPRQDPSTGVKQIVVNEGGRLEEHY